MPPKSELHVIPSSDLQGFASALFQALGVAGPMADEWAKSLVWANLRGVDSHGVLRIPSYIDRLKKKLINPAPNMRVETRAGAIAVLDADRAPGAVAMSRAMDEAIARAREVHFGWCAARNITHAGAIGYFALQAANAGMAGIVMSASGPMMAYHGAKVSGVSSNPLAIAFPARAQAAPPARHVDLECRNGENNERPRRRPRHPAGLGNGRPGTRHHRPQEGDDPRCLWVGRKARVSPS